MALDQTHWAFKGGELQEKVIEELIIQHLLISNIVLDS